MTRKTMRKLFHTSAFAALLLPATALADSIEGRIEKIDETRNTLTLADGTSYQLPGEFDYSVLTQGMRVLIFYDRDGKTRYITDVEPVDPSGSRAR